MATLMVTLYDVKPDDAEPTLLQIAASRCGVYSAVKLNPETWADPAVRRDVVRKMERAIDSFLAQRVTDACT